MFYKIDENGTFGGFFSKNSVDEYKIEDVIEINDDEYKDILDKINMNGYTLMIDNDKKLYAKKEELSQSELDQVELDKKIFFYNSELIFASKACTEFSLGMISESDHEEVKAYMSSISPYNSQNVRRFKRSLIVRPAIFDRYK